MKTSADTVAIPCRAQYIPQDLYYVAATLEVHARVNDTVDLLIPLLACWSKAMRNQK